jgi:hypothetical protein
MSQVYVKMNEMIVGSNQEGKNEQKKEIMMDRCDSS